MIAAATEWVINYTVTTADGLIVPCRSRSWAETAEEARAETVGAARQVFAGPITILVVDVVEHEYEHGDGTFAKPYRTPQGAALARERGVMESQIKLLTTERDQLRVALIAVCDIGDAWVSQHDQGGAPEDRETLSTARELAGGELKP